ncbi:MAG: DMT family transporter [Deltaproteobacteria bacterium]|nr:DMT family transporter [Deltaproteobacteria bacterium]
MQNTIFILASLLMGAMLSIYLPMNSAVSKYLESTITATITFFFVALISSIIIFAVWGESETINKIGDVPFWLYLTGVFSAFMILGTTYLIPKIGMRQFFILTITGQILTAIVLGHYGFLGMPRDPIATKKLIGAVLVIFGAIFSTI